MSMALMPWIANILPIPANSGGAAPEKYTPHEKISAGAVKARGTDQIVMVRAMVGH